MVEFSDSARIIGRACVKIAAVQISATQLRIEPDCLVVVGHCKRTLSRICIGNAALPMCPHKLGIAAQRLAEVSNGLVVFGTYCEGDPPPIVDCSRVWAQADRLAVIGNCAPDVTFCMMRGAAGIVGVG